MWRSRKTIPINMIIGMLAKTCCHAYLCDTPEGGLYDL